MSFWLKHGWLYFLPADPEAPWANFIGSDAHNEDPTHGGFRRITGFGDCWLELLAIDYKPWRLSWKPGQFTETCCLAQQVLFAPENP